MPGLEDFLLLKSVAEYETQQNQAANPLFALAQGVSKGIEEQQQKMKMQKNMKENLALLTGKLGGPQNQNTSGYKIQQEMDLTTGKIEAKAVSKSAADLSSEYELFEKQSFTKDVQSGMSANKLRDKYPFQSQQIEQLEKAGTVRRETIIPQSSPSINQQQIIPSGSNQTSSQQISTEQKPVEDVTFEIEGKDWSGMITGWKPVKKSESAIKRDEENASLSGKTQVMVGLFNDARKESQSYDGYGSVGVEGRIANLGAMGEAKLGYRPKLNVLIDELKAFSRVNAKAGGEVRPTDQDVVDFAKAMINPSKNDAENATHLELVLKRIKIQGQSVSWAEPFVKEFEKTTGQKINFDFSNNTKMIGKYSVRE